MASEEELFYFVKIKYNDIPNSKEYSYLCNDITVKEGDYVIVPRGINNEEAVAVVTSAKFYKFSEAPFPVYQCKYIIGKITVNDDKLYIDEVTKILNEIKENLKGTKEEKLKYLIKISIKYKDTPYASQILREISRMSNSTIDGKDIEVKKMGLKLTEADINAISEGSEGFILSKGAKCYNNEDYSNAAEYYHLAAAMGNMQAVSNLGYCYLYGRHVEANIDLAIQYFKISAHHGIIDSMYKLGDIYSKSKWGKENKEMAIYYYKIAEETLEEKYGKYYFFEDDALSYPSLFYALGREAMPGGLMMTDIYKSFICLKTAEKGYERQLQNGDKMYIESYNQVEKLLEDEIFDEAREDWEKKFNSDDSDDGDIIKF